MSQSDTIAAAGVRRSLGLNLPLVIGAAGVAIFVASALAAPWLAPYSPEAMQVKSRLMSWSAAHLLGTDAFQETDVINITTPVTKWNYQVTDATEIPSVLAKAFYIAGSGRPGPVLIDITKNAQIQKFNYEGYTKCNHI